MIWLTLTLILLFLLTLPVTSLCLVVRALGAFRKRAPESLSDKRVNDRNRGFYAAGIKGREDALSRPKEGLEVVSQDGKILRGSLFRTGPGHRKVVISFHGYRGWAFIGMGRFLGMYEAAGLDVLLIDERAQGASGGRWCTMGVLESADGVLWCRKIVELYGEDVRILLHGTSMGGAAVDMMASREDLPAQVKGVVSDCAFDDVREVVYTKVPKFRFVAKLTLGLMRFWARILTGADLFKAAPLQTISGARVPVLFIHGTADTLVPCAMSKSLHGACPHSAGLYLVEGAPHAGSWQTDPEGYSAVFLEFAGDVLG